MSKYLANEKAKKIFNGVIPSISSNFVFSTSEQIIGKWVDGKTLYKKTLITNVTNGINNFPTTVANPDYMWIDFGNSSIKGEERNNSLVRADYRDNQLYAIGSFIDSKNNTVFVILGNDNALLGIAYITIKYTKTTDNS